ncbi:MAG: glycogen-binding domain-containing protein [Flavobacteriales bacterium]|nr:glycogen-binding domain-containing protein [Flavobacteriales bacterium]
MPKKRTGNTWFVELFLPDGMYQYKFIADGKWITDPNNPRKFDDGWGGNNSVISVGEPVTFFLKGYQNATNVYLSGSFNAWKEKEIAMMQNDSGWYVAITVGSALHEYRFNVDGKWVTDPTSPVVTNEYGEFNNYKIPISNHVFRCQATAQNEIRICDRQFL